MSSFNYDRYFYHLSNGDFNPATATFKALLVTSDYTPNQGTHDTLADITNEVVGTGYTEGGMPTAATVAIDPVAHNIDVSFASVNWPNSTLTARAAVIYVVGSDAAHSYLCAYADFGADKTDTAGTFAVSFTSPLRITN